MFRFSRTAIIVILMLLATLASSLACSKTSQVNAPDTQAQDNLSLLQKNNYLRAKLYALMTFTWGETDTRTWWTEFLISSVPITWKGQVFNGGVTANSLIDQVHGGVSPDGRWFLTLSFSRQIVGSLAYTFTLKNVPINYKGDGNYASDGFEQKGDIGKYIDAIDYNSYAGAKLASVDWSDSSPELESYLKLIFEVEPSNLIGPGAYTGPCE